MASRSAAHHAPGPVSSRLRLDRVREVATITLACPERHNAIDLALATQLDEATRTCAESADTHVVVVRAPGGAFSVGGDIDEFQARGEAIGQHVLDITERFHRASLRLATGRAVSIAVVEGMAAGAGFALALACDIVVATSQARFLTAYSRLGFSPDGGASYFLGRRLGPGRAFEILALNTPLDAKAALHLGLVHRLVTPKGADEALEEVLASLRLATPECLAQTKALVAAAPNAGLAGHLDAERRAIARLAATPEARRRIAGFLDRRRSDTPR